MSDIALYCFRETRVPARRLADQLGVACHDVIVRHFPDGESLVRAPDAMIAPVAMLYRSLDHPNRKLVEVMLAAAALRDGGARQVVLIAPYLAYMRQDMAFRRGEAVSQRVVGSLLAERFDAVVTVDPHLHRIAGLADIMPAIPTRAVAAAPALAEMIKVDRAADTVLIGPDSESRAWVAALAGRLDLAWMVGEKRRSGDRAVALTLPDAARLRGRPAIIVDDLLSTGGTMMACVDEARNAGATRVEAVVTHCIASRTVISHLLASGLDRIRSTDSIPGPTSAVSVASVIAPLISGLVPQLG